MKRLSKRLIYGLVIVIYTGLAYVFKYSTDTHILIVQTQYVFIFLIALYDRKSLFLTLFFLIAGHLTVDIINQGTLPYHVMTESIVQLLTAVFLYVIITAKETQSKRYANVIEASKIGTWEWNLETNVCIYNERWANICGYTLDELRPLSIDTWKRLVHPEDNIESDRKFEAILCKESDDYTHQLRMRHKDGHWVWVQDRGNVVSWTKEGKPKVIAGTHTDITHEMALKDRIKYTRDLMTYIIDHANAAIAVHDREMNYIFASRKYYTDYQIEDDNIIGRNHYDVFPDLPQAWRAVHQRVLKGAVERSDRDPYPRMDGRVDTTRWECRPWYEDDGSIGGLVVYTEVITDLVQRELDLERSKNLLQNVMDSLPIGIAVNSILPHVDFNYMNEKFPLTYRTTREALEQHDHFFEAVYEDPKFREIIKKQVMEDIQSGDPDRMAWKDIPITREGQETRYISAYATPVLGSDMLISTVIDVTEQKLREDEALRIAYTDALTGLWNRLSFSERLNTSDQQLVYPYALLIMDINGLKIINDAFGTEKGNEALKNVGEVLKQVVGSRDRIFRIGGDEFAITLENLGDEEAETLRLKLMEAMRDLTIDDVSYSLSIGLACKASIDEPSAQMLKRAEEDMYKKKVLEGQSVRNRAIMSILSMLADKYEEERVHSERVSELCMTVGASLGVTGEDLEELRMAGMLHDIGKIAIPDRILDKPGKLDDDEWVIMKQHTFYGYNILKAADEYTNLALYALTHHERYDGNGYPKGLKGEEIPLYSRIISVADAYEAMTSDRIYRKRLSDQDALNELKRCSGSQFDPKIIDVFMDIVMQLSMG